jgi:AcrR family transcriptional regulator
MGCFGRVAPGQNTPTSLYFEKRQRILMPKILADVQNTILSSAEDLFKSRGFQQTDMRQIAAHAQIAVGTIYHYYKNKETLFMHVMEHCWSQTIHRIEALSQQEEDPGFLLKEMLQELVQGMSDRRSLSTLWTEIAMLYTERDPESGEEPDTRGQEGETGVNHPHHSFLRSHQNSAFFGMHAQIARFFSRVLEKMWKRDLNEQEVIIVNRLGSFAFVMAVDLCMLADPDTGDPIDLIVSLLANTIEKFSAQ